MSPQYHSASSSVSKLSVLFTIDGASLLLLIIGDCRSTDERPPYRLRWDTRGGITETQVVDGVGTLLYDK